MLDLIEKVLIIAVLAITLVILVVAGWYGLWPK